MLTVKHKVFFSLSIYVILFLHVYILFPHLPVSGQLFQAFLRLLVLTFSIASTHFLINAKPANKLNILKWIFWLMLIPYPLYNILQVRHIAEIFNLNAGEHFAPGPNVNYIWKCLPTLAYSFISAIIGFSCIYITAGKYLNSAIKQFIFSTITISICVLASLYGLHSRLDTYHLFTHIFSIIQDFIHVFSKQEAIINYFFCTGFIVLSYLLFIVFIQFSFSIYAKKNHNRTI